jgi:excisionase family DNA binding protein
MPCSRVGRCSHSGRVSTELLLPERYPDSHHHPTPYTDEITRRLRNAGCDLRINAGSVWLLDGTGNRLGGKLITNPFETREADLQVIFTKCAELRQAIGAPASVNHSLHNAERIMVQTTIEAPVKFLSVQEAAGFLRISHRTLYGLVSQRAIPYRKAGRRVLFLESELIEWTKPNLSPSRYLPLTR